MKNVMDLYKEMLGSYHEGDKAKAREYALTIKRQIALNSNQLFDVEQCIEKTKEIAAP